MLKRPGALLLLVLYLITGIGFVVNLHYCGKMVTGVKIDASFGSCKKTGMMPGMKCCRNKRINIRIKDAHQGQAPTFLSKIFSFRLSAGNYMPVYLLPQSFWTGRFYYSGPRDKLTAATPVFLKNCNFRI